MAELWLAVAAPMSTETLGVGDVARVHIRGLAAGGAGIADLPDGRVVFVPRGAPGDVADVRIRRLKRRWGEARLQTLVEEGPRRVEAPCPRYRRCGGCTLQHLDYEEQLAWKGRFVADALTRIGATPCDPPPVEPSPERTHYRNRVSFTVRRLSGDRIVAGFHALGRPNFIIDVGGECLLPERAVLQAWERLRAAWKAGARPLPSGPELRVTLRSVQEGVSAHIQGGAAGWDGAELRGVIPTLVGVWHRPDDEEASSLVSGTHGHEEWPDRRYLPVGGETFLQVNRSAAKGLVSHVLSQVGTGSSAVDAYCGVGVYGRELAARGWRVTGIEADPDACVAARHQAPGEFSVVEGRVEEHLGSLLPADLAVLNPPRSGLSDHVPEELLKSPPGRIVYVSCDPATLARDVLRLRGGYRLASLHAFDLFPQTAHVETVAVLETAPEG
jgi:23S rRNA (uracil1939-C5)-methyltransferase